MRRILCALGLHAFAYHRHTNGGVVTHRTCRHCRTRQKWQLYSDGSVQWERF